MQREPFLAKCHNCHNWFEIPEQEVPASWKGQHTSTTDTDSIAVVCDVCKYARFYKAADFPPLGITDKPFPFATGGSLDLFRVTLGCDNADCQVRLTVLAPKKSKTTHEDVIRDSATWDVPALSCPRGHQIVIPPPEKLRAR